MVAGGCYITVCVIQNNNDGIRQSGMERIRRRVYRLISSSLLRSGNGTGSETGCETATLISSDWPSPSWASDEQSDCVTGCVILF